MNEFPKDRVRLAFTTDDNTETNGKGPKKEIEAAAKPRTISQVSEEIRKAGVAESHDFEPV